MKIEVLGKNGFVPSQTNKDYAQEKLAKIEHYFQDQAELEARVVCKVYSEYHKVEVTIPAKNIVLRAEAQDQDVYSALDKALDKLVAQIVKYKTRTKSKENKEGIKEIFSNDAFDAKALEKEIIASQLVRSKKVELSPMTVDEAIEHMELTGHDFFIFQNKNGRYPMHDTCLSYKFSAGTQCIWKINRTHTYSLTTTTTHHMIFLCA